MRWQLDSADLVLALAWYDVVFITLWPTEIGLVQHLVCCSLITIGIKHEYCHPSSTVLLSIVLLFHEKALVHTKGTCNSTLTSAWDIQVLELYNGSKNAVDVVNVFKAIWHLCRLKPFLFSVKSQEWASGWVCGGNRGQKPQLGILCLDQGWGR